MHTPSGRFKPNTQICLSMTDFHPESWNPMWSTTTILVGFQSFMLEEAPSFGSISSSSATKRQYAIESLEYNVRNRTFTGLFPELVDVLRKQRQQLREASGGAAAGTAAAATATDADADAGAGATAGQGLAPGLALPVLVGLLAMVLGSFYLLLRA